MTTCNELNYYEAPQSEEVLLRTEESILQSGLGKGGSQGKEELDNNDLEPIGYEPL